MIRYAVKAGTALVFSAPASGVPSPTFQWRRNGIDIPGATSRTLHLNEPQPEDEGTFTCLLCNLVGCEEWQEVLVAIV